MAMGLLAKLLMTRQLKFEGGHIDLKNIYMSLIPCFFIGEMTRYFHNEKKLHHLYLISWLWGFVLVGQVKNRFKLDTPAKAYTLGMNLAEAMGIGIYKTHDYVPGRYTHFAISNNPYLDSTKGIETTEPIDYFISGCMGGGGCHVHDQLCQNVEVQCRLKGDSVCDFITGTEKELKDRNLWEIARQRYHLDESLPLLKRFYDRFVGPDKVLKEFDGSEGPLMGEIMNEIQEID